MNATTQQPFSRESVAQRLKDGQHTVQTAQQEIRRHLAMIQFVKFPPAHARLATAMAEVRRLEDKVAKLQRRVRKLSGKSPLKARR